MIIKKEISNRKTIKTQFTRKELKYFRMGLGAYLIFTKRTETEQNFIKRVLEKLSKVLEE